jgi:hypothetical protein
LDHLIQSARQGDDGETAAPLARLRFRADVHAAAIGPDAVLLDVARDAYHCLPGGARLCSALIMEGLSPEEPQVRELDRAGLLSTDLLEPRTPPPPRPRLSVIHASRPVDLLRDPGPALAALRHLRRARCRGGLRPYLDLGEAPRVDDPRAAMEAGRRFWTLLPYLPVEGECLVRSTLLMSFLACLGLRADWVFGVRLHPFAAHCWVQVNGVCLNDDVERLAPYTPIMVR